MTTKALRIVAKAISALALIYTVTVNAQTSTPPVMSTGPLLDIIRMMPDASWRRVNVNKFQDVWTPPDLTPLVFGGVPDPHKIIYAWSGFAWDTQRGDLIIYGGGHGNYSGNDVYRWHSSTLQWERASLPSEVAAYMGTDVYMPVDGPDNAPPSAHTYDNSNYLPIADRFMTWGGAAFQTGSHYIKADATGTGVRATGPYLFDPAKADGDKVGGTTGSHVQRVAPHEEVVGGNMWTNRDIYANAPTQSIPQLFVEGCSGYTQEYGHDVVYVAASSSGASYADLYRYEMVSLADPSRDLMTRVGSYGNGLITQSACAYDAGHKTFVRTGVNGAPLQFWDLAAPGPYNYDKRVTVEGSIADLSSWLTTDGKFAQFCGLDYDPIRKQSLFWCGDGNVWSITDPSPASNHGWAAVLQPAPPDGSAVPPNDPGVGILGKWKYIPGYDVFMGLEDYYDGNVWVYRPAGWVDPQQLTSPPTISILNPGNGSLFAPGATITLTAQAESTSSSVTKVEFFDGSSLVGTATSAPYSVVWPQVPAGIHTLTARATDDNGALAISTPSIVSMTAAWNNVALAANGGVASASTTYSSAYAPSGANDGDRTGLNWGNGGGWNDATANAYPDWLQITFNGQKTINQIDVFTIQDDAQNPIEPTATTVFTQGGITDFQVQSWDGAAWITVPNGAITGNNLVWRHFSFDVISTDRIRVLVNNALANYSRIVEIEARYASADGGTNTPPAVNLTAPANGATFTAPATVALAATAADSDGSVSRVDFYRGTTLIASSTTAPYTYSDAGLASGTYSYRAVAFDNAGASTTSNAATIAVSAAGNTPPTVSLTSPASGATFTAPATVSLAATAADSDGTVAKVDFYRGTTLIGSAASAPYAYSDTGLAAGTYSYTAKAYDNAGAATTSTAATVTVTTDGTTPVNVASAANGAVASASSFYSAKYPPAGAINGDRKGLNWGNGGGWNDATASSFPDWLQVTFSATQTIGEIDVFTIQDNYLAADPTLSMTFTQNGITSFNVQYWNGTAWTDVPGGNVTGNNLVWRQFTFTPITTDRIRVLVNAAASKDGNYSRIAEIEAWTATGGTTNAAPTVSLTSPASGATFTAPATVSLAATAADSDGTVAKVDFYRGTTLIGSAASAPYAYSDTGLAAGTYSYTAKAYDNAGAATTSTAATVTVTTDGTTPVNVASAANGAVASASSFYSAKYPPAGAINGDRKGLNWGNGGGWNDATASSFPDWLQVTFSATQTIGEIDVFTIQDNYLAADPTLSMTFTQNGITSFNVQYWNGTAWTDVPGGNVTGNNLVWRQFTFTPITTDRIRVLVNAAASKDGNYSRIAEIEAWTATGGTTNAAPTVSLTSPASGATFTAPATVSLAATAADSDGTVAKVDFYRGTTLIGSAASAPYAYSDTGLAAGTYSYTAKAYDNAGAATTSTAATVTVTTDGTTPVNVASAANGAVASASSFYSAKYPPAGAINGDRKGLNWGNGGGWNDATASSFPDWLQVTFSATQTIGEIDVFTIQDNYLAADPTLSMTFTQNGITSFNVQYWNGTAWTDVPGGNVTGNNLVWRQFTFTPITTDRIRVLVNAAASKDGNYSRIAEIEAWTP